MKNIVSVTILPFLKCRDDTTVGLDKISIKPSTHLDFLKPPINEHLQQVLKIFSCRYTPYCYIRDCANHDEFLQFERQIGPAFIAYRYAMQAYLYSIGQEAPVYGFCDRFSCVSDTRSPYGYTVYKNGQYASFINNGHQWPHILYQVDARWDVVLLDFLLKKQGDSRFLGALEWFNTACRNDASPAEQVISLSMALEALFDAPADTSSAEVRLKEVFREVIPDLEQNKIESLLEKARKNNVFSGGITASFKKKIFELTNSEPITKYAAEFYNLGSRIRHGGDSFSQEFGWYGQDKHLFIPKYSKKLFTFFVEQLRFKESVKIDNKISKEEREVVFKTMVRDMENDLVSDQKRIQELLKIAALKESPQKLLLQMCRNVGFIYHSGVDEGIMGQSVELLGRSLQLVKLAEPELYKEIEEQATWIESVACGKYHTLDMGNAANNILNRLLRISKITSGHVVLFGISKYCATICYVSLR